MYELALQALERQQNVHEVLESSNEDHPKARIEQEVVSRQAEVRPATKVLKENVPPAKEHLHKQKKNVVQYSRRPIPTAKQKEQAMQTQHLLEMKEYFAEVVISNDLCSRLGTLLLFAWHDHAAEGCLLLQLVCYTRAFAVSIQPRGSRSAFAQAEYSSHQPISPLSPSKQPHFHASHVHDLAPR